jgi:hypothetical protein
VTVLFGYDLPPFGGGGIPTLLLLLVVIIVVGVVVAGDYHLPILSTGRTITVSHCLHTADIVDGGVTLMMLLVVVVVDC